MTPPARIRLLLVFLPLLTAAAIPGPSSRAQEAMPIGERIELCVSCHGADGVPVDETTPIIAGQQFYYLYVQLRDYEAGRRSNEIMSEIVAGMSRDEMKALAEHFAQMDWPRVDSDVDPAAAEAGERHLVAGQCSQCHSTYKGDSRVPRVAGQQRAYLEQTMLDFKNKVRLNSPAKGSLLESFSDADIAAIAHNLAGR